jgi:hypothetical protein
MEESVRKLELTDRDHERVMLLARAWQISGGEVVRRLLDDFARPDDATTEYEQPPDDGVQIYADYEGNHIEAIYYAATRRVDIVSGVLNGRSYRSPSGAAIAVVQAHNPTVHPNRNGWTFWFITKTGQALQAIRPR